MCLFLTRCTAVVFASLSLQACDAKPVSSELDASTGRDSGLADIDGGAGEVDGGSTGGGTAQTDGGPTGGGTGAGGGGGGGTAEVDGGSTGGGTAQTDGGPAGGGTGAGGTDSGVVFSGMLPASVSCAPATNRCAPTSQVSGLFASYRKDAWLPEADYNEVGTRPVNGGRFHIAGISAVTGRVTGLRLNGQDADSLLPQVDKLEWYHVWPQQVVAGQPVWVAFHSRNRAWDTASSATIRVTTSAGDALDGTFTVATTPAPLTYVTTADQGQTLLIHAHNDDSVPHTLSRLLVNGRDVTGPGLACVAEPTIAPGASVLWVVPRCTASLPGDAWTVVAEYVGAPAAVGVGRVLPEHFGIEAWPHSRDCVWPRDLAVHQAAGFDTLFTRWGGYCGSSGESLVNTGLLADAGFASLLTHDFLTDNNPGQAITNQTAVAGLFIGDEVDGELFSPAGVNLVAENATETRALWNYYPRLPVYQGSKTNKNVGSYAGATDVQGSDFYVAACAPHITAFGTHPPLRGAFDYLRNARNNHMPWPTWLYAQGLSAAWNKTINVPILGTRTVTFQPDPQEIVVQGISALAAGGKGLMWFQSNLAEARASPPRWAAITKVNRMTRAVAPWLLEGDTTGMAETSANALVEVIRARDAMVVTVIGLATTSEPTDTSCASATVSSAVPHFQLAAQNVSVRVNVPADFAVTDVFEVTESGPAAAPPLLINQRQLTLAGVAIDNARAARIFVLALSPTVRTRVAAALGP